MVLIHERDARLREMDFGSWEGRRWRDIPQGEFEIWMQHFAEHAVGGGESVQALMGRVALALEDTHQRVLRSVEVTKDVVWITHAGVIRAVTLLMNGVTELRSGSQWPSEAPEFGQWCELTLPQGNAV